MDDGMDYKVSATAFARRYEKLLELYMKRNVFRTEKELEKYQQELENVRAWIEKHDNN